MPRIIVTTDPVSSKLSDQTPVLLDEHVHAVHLSTDHAAAQLVQRLAWAVKDAESAESVRRLERRVRQEQQARRGSPAAPRARATRANARRSAEAARGSLAA
jgi:hypothetical protein